MTHCDQPLCESEDAIECRVLYANEDGTDMVEHYCPEHAEQNGYCWGCGLFCAGIERFDFAESYGGIKGLCENCEDEVKADMGEYDDHDEAPWDYAEDVP